VGVKQWPLGTNAPFGIPSDYSWPELGALFHIIDDFGVQLVVETGAGRGDLAAWMISVCKWNLSIQYLGITNDPNAVDTRVRESVADRAFISVGAACSPFMVRRVSSLVKNSSCAMILCNGLDIGREVDHYLPVLRSGDVIVAHQFIEKYSGSRLVSMSRDGSLKRISGDTLGHTRFIAGILE
jgi:hypothetical protein